jgi:hypothetical protein
MTDAADRARALSDEGEALLREGRMAAAEVCYREAAALAPTATRLFNRGALRQLVGDQAAAEALFRQALAMDPGHAHARAALGMALLAQGRLAEGFPLYEAWRQVPGAGMKPPPDVGLPAWAGEDVAGKNLLLWGEEGFGDQIMFARFAPLLQAQGAEVGWVCNRVLLRLLREGLGVEAVASGGALAVGGADYLVPTSRLPVILMPRLGAPPPAPYLRAPRPNVAPGLTIGIVARGNPEHANDRYRSLTADAAAELMALPGAVSLAPADTGARDFWDTAGIIQGLDLVIAVDTSVAHLAGALGKPVWVLLPAIGCDWRWGLGRSDSPWYPSMRLFRQTTPGDWSGVLAEVRAALS